MNEADFLPDETATGQLGAALAACVRPPAVIYLSGGLGAGKTTLVRGLLRARGVTGACRSPTYTLVEPYETPEGPVFHFDLYRLGAPEELDFIGLRDYVDQEAICLIEWPERGAGALPEADLEIGLTPFASGRKVGYRAHSSAGRRILESLGHSEEGDG